MARALGKSLGKASRVGPHRRREAINISVGDEAVGLRVKVAEFRAMVGEVFRNGAMDDLSRRLPAKTGDEADRLDVFDENSHWGGAKGGHVGWPCACLGVTL